MRTILFLLTALILWLPGRAQQQTTDPGWWKRNNLRVIQTNLPDYEAATLNPDSLVTDLVKFSANTLIINAGGIMAFYPTKLPYQYRNPYVKRDFLKDVVAKCHQQGIKVIVRFDFSRVHESIYKAHPDWCYLSPKGERMTNPGMYTVSINGPYVQQCAFGIVSEVMDIYPIDGIFLNMPGYQVNNTYEGRYMGIDQNEYDKKRFAKFSGGKALPVEENKADSLYQQYLAFKKFTLDEWGKRLYTLVKSKNPQAAICTYTDQYVDIIRHETQAVPTLPLWPYSAADNVNNAGTTFPDHIISNASIQQISFQSRYNAIEPEEISIRLYQNMAHGSGLDLSMMGDTRGYEDERNFKTIENIYGLHKKYEPYFGRYTSIAKIAVIAPGSWPNGTPMQEYRGIQQILQEAHIPFDIIEDNQLQNRGDKLKNYKVIILPDITFLNDGGVKQLKAAIANGTNLVATNIALNDNPALLSQLFGAKLKSLTNDAAGNYLVPEDRAIFKNFRGQTMLFMKYNLALYDFSSADKTGLPLLAKGRTGPPEIIGGHDVTGDKMMAIKQHGAAEAVLLPFNAGRLYYNNGYQEHKQLFLDVLNNIYPDAEEQLITNAPPKIETVLQQYAKNTPANKINNNGLILHLINLTGVSSTSYLPPLPVYNISLKIKSGYKPTRITDLLSGRPVKFTYADGYVNLTADRLDDYKIIVMDK